MKQAIWEVYRLYDYNSMTLWERQNYGDNRKLSVCPEWQQAELNRQSPENTQDSENTLYDIAKMGMGHYAFI